MRRKSTDQPPQKFATFPFEAFLLFRFKLSVFIIYYANKQGSPRKHFDARRGFVSVSNHVSI